MGWWDGGMGGPGVRRRAGMGQTKVLPVIDVVLLP